MNLPPVSDEENTQRKERHNRSCHETVRDNHNALGEHGNFGTRTLPDEGTTNNSYAMKDKSIAFYELSNYF